MRLHCQPGRNMAGDACLHRLWAIKQSCLVVYVPVQHWSWPLWSTGTALEILFLPYVSVWHGVHLLFEYTIVASADTTDANMYAYVCINAKGLPEISMPTHGAHWANGAGAAYASHWHSNFTMQSDCRGLHAQFFLLRFSYQVGTRRACKSCRDKQCLRSF